MAINLDTQGPHIFCICLYGNFFLMLQTYSVTWIIMHNYDVSLPRSLNPHTYCPCPEYTVHATINSHP